MKTQKTISELAIPRAAFILFRDFPTNSRNGRGVIAYRPPATDYRGRAGEPATKRVAAETYGNLPEEAVPRKCILSRILEWLGGYRHLDHLHTVFDAMIERLGDVATDLGYETGGDTTHLNARCKSMKDGADSPEIERP